MNIVDRVKNIIMSPKTEWQAVAAEEPNVGGIFTGYVLPLAILSAAATFVGLGFIGGPLGISVKWGLAQGIISLISTVLAVLLTAFIVDALAGSFSSEKNFGRSLQLVAYGYTPTWIAGILTIIPVLGFFVFIGSLYGLYLMYLGLPILKKTPQDKAVIYLIVIIVVLVILYFVLMAILGTIIFGLLGLSLLGAASAL